MNDRPWVPLGWRANPRRVLVLGESAYAGAYTPEQSLAVNWVPAYLRGDVRDGTYSKVANAVCGPTHGRGLPARRAFWNEVAFGNFVILGAGTRPNSDRPTKAEWQAGMGVLKVILADLQPAGVWVWGKEQAEYSVPVIKDAGIKPVVVVSHPTRGYSYTITESWAKLIADVTLAIGPVCSVA